MTRIWNQTHTIIFRPSHVYNEVLDDIINTSENSPILRWIRRTCLGFDDTHKTYQRTPADWILKAPLHMRKSILQGLGDGDGSVSVKGDYFCISSKSNREFIQNLIDSFHVKTRCTKGDVVSSGMEAAKKAAQIPPFRYAQSRLDAGERMIKRIEARRDTRKDPLKPHEIKFILSMKKKGLSNWDTSEIFLDEFGTAIDKRMVERLYRKASKRK